MVVALLKQQELTHLTGTTLVALEASNNGTKTKTS